MKQFQNYLRRYGYRAASSDSPPPQRKITPAEMLEQPQASRRLTPLTVPSFLAPQARLFRQWSMLAHSLLLGMILTIKTLGWYSGLYYQQQHIAQEKTTQHSENQEQAVAQTQKAKQL